MADDTLADMRATALKLMHDTIGSETAKAADKLRAAEAILRASADVPGAEGDGQAEDASDAELLAIARGVHPPLMGPAGTTTAPVPSHAGTDRFPKSADRGLGEWVGGGVERGPIPVPANGDTRGADTVRINSAPAADGVPRETNPFLKRGPPGLVLPKKGPKGTQKGPANSPTPPPGIARLSEMDDDIDPCS